MIKTICDICGEDITEVPMMTTWTIEVKVSDERALAEHTFHICQDHTPANRIGIIHRMFHGLQATLKEKI